MSTPVIKWTKEKVTQLFNMPFINLIYLAQTIHRRNFDPRAIQISTLLSIKTGNCPEDCAYCPQSAHYQTGVNREKLMSVEAVIAAAKAAKKNGASRFCMGAAWRSPPKAEFYKVLAIVSAVKALGLETCITLGMLNAEQAQQLKAAGLDFYNHNLDTSAEFYSKIITTRTYQDRLDTLQRVHDAGIQLCCGGIIGMGERLEDRVDLLLQLTNLPEPPKSVPINLLIRIKGTPLEDVAELESMEYVRTIAVARIIFPKSFVRLSAGRESMSDEMQALCFIAGANSIFYGEKLLVTGNPAMIKDKQLLKKLDMIMI